MKSDSERLQLLEEFYWEIRKLVRNSGKTSFVSKGEIGTLLEQYNGGVKK